MIIMEAKPDNVFIKSDDNKFVNVKYIRWVKKMNDCFEVCSKSNGCVIKDQTHQVCRLNNPDSYKKIMDLISPLPDNNKVSIII
jgi:hypothetical protein